MVQLVACQTADPGVKILILSVEIDHEIISTVIFLLPLIQEGLLPVTSKKHMHEVLVNHIVELA